MKKQGVTLIEIMVGVVILSMISIPIYYILKESAHKRAVVFSKDHAKQEANKVLKILENDLSQARRNSFKQPSDDVYEIKVRKEGDDKDSSLRYLYLGTTLKRRFDGKEWTVSDNVEEFSVEKTPDAVGRLVASIKVSAAFDGIKQNEAPVYEQEKIIVMREDAAFERDKHWRDVGDVNKFFATQGSLMGSIKSDAKKLVQGFTSEFADMGKDIAGMTIGELEKVKGDLFKGLNDVKSNLTSIDKDIRELDNKAMFDGGSDGKLSKSEKRRANNVKKTLAGMDTKDKMDWNKVKAAGGGGGLFSDSMDVKAIKEMYNAKMELFNSGQEVVKQIDDFAKQAGEKGLKVDTSVIDHSKWGL